MSLWSFKTGLLIFLVWRIIDLITYRLPSFVLYKISWVCGNRRREILARLPFRNLKIRMVLPDGNSVVCCWQDRGAKCDVYDKSLYERFYKPRKGNVVVDVGAHIGLFTLKIALQVGEKGRVIAVEPEKKNYAFLTENIRINRYRNVTPVDLALSDFEGKARFFLKARSVSHSLFGKTFVTPIIGSTEVDVTTLDKMLEKLAVNRVDLLKINVEGAELNVLKGGEHLLSEGRISNIVLATHPPRKKEAEEISEYLRSMGYTTTTVSSGKVVFASLKTR